MNGYSGGPGPGSVLAADVSLPHIDYAALSPMLVVFGVAVAGVLVEAFAPRRARYAAQLILAVAGLIGAFVAVVLLAGTSRIVMSGSVYIDGTALFLQGTVVIVGLLSVLLFAERRGGSRSAAATEVRRAARGRASVRSGAEGGSPGAGLDAFTPQAFSVPGGRDEALALRAGAVQTEVFPLALFAIGGMMLFPASGDLITMFIALEVLSLPLYLLCGLARHRRMLSQEAALKYFLLGAFSSGFFIFGTALLYGYAGTVSLDGIARVVEADVGATGPGGQTVLALAGIAVLAVGLLFKVGAAPFHSWVPDVYQGAPTPVTAFMASATKIAAFGALMRVFLVAVPGLHSQWRPVMWLVAVVTMVLGSVIALTQTDIKRMLAYSSISHIGFMLTALVPGSDNGRAALLFYLATYGVSVLGAFGLVSLVRRGSDEAGAAAPDGMSPEEPDTARWAGLGRRHPVFGAAMSLLLLAFAGIPLTSGFVAKFVVFGAALDGGDVALVIVGVVCSAIAAFFYLRVIVQMYFADGADTATAADPAGGGTVTVAQPGVFTAVAAAVSVIVTIVLGVAPQPLLDLIAHATPVLP